MDTITLTEWIDAPPADVWEVLDDFGSIERWSPGVKRSFLTTPGPTAVGTTRHCDFIPFGSAKERIEEYDPERRLAVRLHDLRGMPFDEADAVFHIAPEAGGTRLTFEYTARAKGLARLFEGLIARLLRRGLRGLVEGLKHECETAAR